MQTCLLQRVGNSAAVTIPVSLRKTLGWEIGDSLSLHLTAASKLVLRRVVYAKTPANRRPRKSSAR